MRVVLVKKIPVAKNTTIFWFAPEKPIRYTAGQYIQLHISHPKPDKRGSDRWFTLSSSPTEELLAITTRLDPVRKSSFKQALNKLSIGASLSMQLPMGDFVLPKDNSVPLVFIAGGIGITPYRSILKYLSDKRESRDITLIYAVRNKDQFAYLGLIKKSPAKLIKHIGILDGENIVNHLGGLKEQIIYLSGPEPMVEKLQDDLLARGVNETLIRTDFFHNYTY